jgi:hypothetical protein
MLANNSTAQSNPPRRGLTILIARLIDIGLPKVAGREVLLKIKNENPDVESGYRQRLSRAEAEVRDRPGRSQIFPAEALQAG